ncbi:hypothetical protein N802_04270 [Knoellia sinensis KCTC 19936]|uniref:HTH luxR-type domain-containing protein n=1 Tax=Knoellia sinensis KCTC 19936 TaxID=1385520 RepID=A0A0A0J1K7_9MICO|nr:LuxR family transcriptional regulator [Knoellia sinensis]KGN31310.1 hypothetical protein N802_04270 [Knoellia sinensis KCTC 19936]
MALAAQGGERMRPVGRDDELRALTHALGPQGHAEGRVVLVRGEPGIGKTTLIEAALGEVGASAGRVLRAGADAMGQRRPYWPLLNALAVDVGEGKGSLAGPKAADGHSDLGLGEHVLDLIDVLAARGPLTLVLEDLQWADRGTLAVLVRLTRSLPQQPIVIVCSTRPLPHSGDLDQFASEAEARHLLTTIDLGPLGHGACTELAEVVTGARVDDTVAHQLESAGGNPLFLIEMLGVAQRDGSLTVAPDGTARLNSSPDRPPSLALMIMNHLSALSAPARDLLLLASVLGARFPIADLRLIARQPVSELMPALTEVMAAGVLGEVDAATLTFRHGLIQEVLLADVPETIRGELHHEIARRLDEVGAPPVAVAEHLLRAPPAAEFVPWTLELADRVVPMSGGTALELWRHVMDATALTDPAHVRAMAGIARVYLRLGRTADAADLARDALERGAADGFESHLRVTLSQAVLFGGDVLGAEDEALRAGRSPRLSPKDRAAHLALAGWPRLLVGDTEEALARARTAEQAAADAGNVSAGALASVLRGHIAACRGDLGEALELLSRAVEVADAEPSLETIEAFPHQLAGIVLADLDRVPESRAMFERGRRLAERLGYLPGVFSAFYLGSRSRALSSHLNDVEADLEARDSLRDKVDLQMDGPILGTRAWVALHRDGPDAAQPWITRLGDLAATSGLGRGLAWIYGPASSHAAALGDSHRAFDILWSGWERCLARTMVMDCVQLAVPLAALAVEVGARDSAEAARGVVSVAAAANPDVAHLRATALVVGGLVEEDAQQVRAGADLFATTPRRLAHAQASELAAVALARQGNAAESVIVGEEALCAYRAVGADHDVRAARARLASRGVRLKGHRAESRPTTGWGALTRTEETVARHVARGLSNPEVAEILVVSRRTVESHVSHVLAKLGLRSRAELVLFVARRVHDVPENGHELEPAPEGRAGAPLEHRDLAGRRPGVVERDLDEHASP